MKLNSLDDLIKDLEILEKNPQKLSGDKTVPFEELFDYKFMNKYTNFDSINEFFREADIEVNSQEEFQEVDEEILDEAVIRFTNFTTWEEMNSRALEIYIENQILKGVKF